MELYKYSLMKLVCFVSMIVTNDSVWTDSAKNVLTFTLQIGIDGAYKNCSFSTSLPSKKKKNKSNYKMNKS